MSRLTNQDQDQVSGISVKVFFLLILLCGLYSFLLTQEVKECAISCMGLVVSTFGDNLKAELPACLPVLVDRMGNEITRLTAVKVGLLHLLFIQFWRFLQPDYVHMHVRCLVCMLLSFSRALTNTGSLGLWSV